MTTKYYRNFIKEYYNEHRDYLNDMAAAASWWHELNNDDIECLAGLYAKDGGIVNLDHCIIRLMQRR